MFKGITYRNQAAGTEKARKNWLKGFRRRYNNLSFQLYFPEKERPC